VADGATKWVRATRATATGVAQFFTSNDGVTWTQLGTDVASTASAIFDSVGAVEIGANRVGTNNFLAGKVYYAEVRNGIAGTVVGVFDPQAIRVTDTRLPATVPSRTGETWTLNGTGWAWQVEG
jgi:hypothetical protein